MIHTHLCEAMEMTTPGVTTYAELTGAEITIRCLQEEGVEFVFGYPGGAILPIYDEMFKQDKVKHILVRHEQAAVHGADGYARATERVGVVMVTSGPGVTNAVTGIATAYMVSNVKFYSGKDINLRKSVPFSAIVMMALGVGILVLVADSDHPLFNLPELLFVLFVAYAASGYVMWLMRLLKRKSGAPPAPPPSA